MADSHLHFNFKCGGCFEILVEVVVVVVVALVVVVHSEKVWLYRGGGKKMGRFWQFFFSRSVYVTKIRLFSE